MCHATESEIEKGLSSLLNLTLLGYGSFIKVVLRGRKIILSRPFCQNSI